MIQASPSKPFANPWPVNSANNGTVIAVMGPTGSGKSTFINMASSLEEATVGSQLRSCSNEVRPVNFQFDSLLVTLVDTPGFDDTSMPDTEALKLVSRFLETTYRSGVKLSGVLYFHRISDRRMGNTATRNFRMFRELCGGDFMQNVAIVTTMWEEIDERRGSERERELASEDDFFKPALDKGATMYRHHNTRESAQQLLRLLVKNHPKPLQIQLEIVDQQKSLCDTSAGIQLNEQLRERAQRHRHELEELRREMEEAAEARDEQTRGELADEMRKIRAQLARKERELRNFSRQITPRKSATSMLRTVKKIMAIVLLMIPFAVLLRIVFPFLTPVPPFGATSWTFGFVHVGVGDEARVSPAL